jgi:biotin carboxylase
MKNVLLVDTNFSSFPIYNYLVDSGYNVFVVGRDPEDFLARSAPNYVQLDYSDIDALGQLEEKLDIDVVLPGCNDHSYQACAALMAGRATGLDAADTTRSLFDKGQFRKLCDELRLPAPKRVDPAAGGLPEGVPVIVKPVDAFSGKGISILKNATEESLQETLGFAVSQSGSGEALIEEYVEGQLFSHSAFISGGKISTDFIVREYSSVNPFVVDVSFVDRGFDSTMLDTIRSSVERIAAHLNLRDGLFHTQFISDGQHCWMIEVTRRCPGDLYSRLIERSTGFNYAAAYAECFLGNSASHVADCDDGLFVMRHTITQNQTCGFLSLDFGLNVPFEFVPVAITGESLSPSPGGRVGLVFAKAADEEALSNLVDATLRNELYTLERLRENGGH